MTEQQTVQTSEGQNTTKLVALPDVLAASIGIASKRERTIGRYHVSDLHSMGVVDCARLYAGVEPERDFPAYLSKRGLKLEEMALSALPPAQRQVEVLYQIGPEGPVIVGHPDGLTIDEDGDPVLIECASQLSEEDDNKEQIKLEQVVSYAGLVNAGARLALSSGHEVVGTVKEVRIQLCGLWGGQEVQYYEIGEMAAERAEWVTAKMVLAHELAVALSAVHGAHPVSEDSALREALVKAEGSAQRWDARYPSQGRFEYEVAPVLEGERGEEADATVSAYSEWKRWEKVYEEHKKRWLATLDLQTLKKVKAPGGGTLTLRAKNTTTLNGEVFNHLGGTKLEVELEGLRKQRGAAVARLEAELRQAQEILQRAIDDHPATEQIAELERSLGEIRGRATDKGQEPIGILCTPPRGKKA